MTDSLPQPDPTCELLRSRRTVQVLMRARRYLEEGPAFKGPGSECAISAISAISPLGANCRRLCQEQAGAISLSKMRIESAPGRTLPTLFLPSAETLGLSGSEGKNSGWLKCFVLSERALGFSLSPFFQRRCSLSALSPLFDQDAQKLCCYAPPSCWLVEGFVWCRGLLAGRRHGQHMVDAWESRCSLRKRVCFLFVTLLDPIWGGKVLWLFFWFGKDRRDSLAPSA
jgi:hypothetical protein